MVASGYRQIVGAGRPAERGFYQMRANQIESGGDIVATHTSKGGRKAGPDLLARAGMADCNRILSQLEHGSTPVSTALPALHWRPSWLALAGAALASTLLLAWLAYEAMPATPAPAPPLMQRTVIVPVPVPAPAPAALPAAATIINQMPAAQAAPQAAAPPHKRQAPARAASVKPASGAPAGDSDVTLLAAIVAHGQRTQPVRDVVLRKEEEDTSSLLQRCRQLGLIEGMLCRARICAGRWDSDPACH